MNKQINQHHRHNKHICIPLCLLGFAAAHVWGWGLGGTGAGRGSTALLSACALQHCQHLSHQATSLGHAHEDSEDGNTQPTALPPGPSTLLRLILLQVATGPPWVLALCNAIRNCPWNMFEPCGANKSPGRFCIPENAPHDIQCLCVHQSRSKTLAAPESSRATCLCFVFSVLRKSLTTLSKQSHWTKMQTTSRTGGLLKNAFHF